MKKLLYILGCFSMFISPIQAIQINYNGDLMDCIDKKDLVLELDELLVPGDSYQETIHFESNYDHEISLALELNNKLEGDIYEMKVYKDEELLVEIDDLTTTSRIDLGKYETYEACDLTFEIAIPVELDNAYTYEAEEVNWKLIVVEDSLPNTGIYSNSTYLIVGISCFVVAYLTGKGGRRNEEAK